MLGVPYSSKALAFQFGKERKKETLALEDTSSDIQTNEHLLTLLSPYLQQARFEENSSREPFITRKLKSIRVVVEPEDCNSDIMGTFPPNGNDFEDEVMMVCNDYNGASASLSSKGETSPSYFQQRNGLGNDFCPHSSQLFPLMEADDEIPLAASSLRKQTAVTCLTALAEEEFEERSGSAHHLQGDFIQGGGGGLLFASASSLVAEADQGDEWGQFAHHHETQLVSSTRRVRLPSRRRPHQRRRSPAKYDRHGSSILSASNAWRKSVPS